jgi:hypothetical protein
MDPSHRAEDSLTMEHIRRRIESALPSNRPARPDQHDNLQAPLFAPPDRPGLALRVRTRVVEQYLPHLNLTSYNSLVRALSKWERTALERDRLATDLATVVAERERLQHDFEEAALERHRLLEQLEAVTGERDQLNLELASVVAGVTRLESDVQVLTATRNQLLVDLRAAMTRTERLHVRLTELRGETGSRVSLALVKSLMDPMQASLGRIEGELRRIATSKSGYWLSAKEQVFSRFDATRTALLTRAVLPQVRSLLLAHYGDESDPNLGRLLLTYDQAERDDAIYWDVRAAVRALSHHLEPRTYLEIGTRRGWSIAQVFAEAPNVRAFVFEMWEPNYGSAEQGSHQYIRNKLQDIVGSECTPEVHFIDGNSHDTLPAFFANPQNSGAVAYPHEFDLITVDGDHSRLGAWWDLVDALPRVTVGGALVFDDLDYQGDDESTSQTSSRFEHPSLPNHIRSLMDVWLHVQLLYPNFLFLTCPTLEYRAGMAIRFE